MAECKNCESVITYNATGICDSCLEDCEYLCKSSHCDIPVRKENSFCGECNEAMAESKADAEREEIMLEKRNDATTRNYK